MTSKHAALIRFVWRVKEKGRSGWLCFLDRWKSALGTSLSEDVRGCDFVIIESHRIALIGKGMVVKTRRVWRNNAVLTFWRWKFKSGVFGHGLGRGRGCGRSRDDSERVERDAMLHVTGVVNNKMGLAREDFGCDRGGGRMSGKGRDGSKEGA
ncbi:hypothetical protein Tco_0812541 [Tanacetum coccineum]